MNFEKYSRLALIDWLDLEKIRNHNVIVIGAGAIGNELIKNLALIGIGRTSIIDHDCINTHNLTRSILFTEEHVDCNKAEIAAKAANDINSDCNFTFKSDDFWKCLTISEIKQADAVFCCTDNFEARIRVNKLCRIAKTDFYNAAIDSRYITFEVYPFSSNPEAGCYECNLTPSVYQNIAKRYSCGWLQKIAFQEQKIPTTIITASMAAAGLLSMFLHLDKNQDQDAKRVFLDTISWNSSVFKLIKNPECPNCFNISQKIKHLVVKNKTDHKDIMKYIDNDKLLELSEPVIIDAECKNCNEKQVICDLAAKYDERITYCDKCGTNSKND